MKSIIHPFKLGYVDFDCLDLNRLTDYYESIMGFTTVEEGKKRNILAQE